MHIRTIGRLALLTGMVAMTPLQAETDQAEAIQRGEAHYLFFCANCHGVDALGDGPLAVHLKIVPSNLTILQIDGSGIPVAERVMKALDGRHSIGESADHKMPVFSESLEMKTVVELTEYLKSIQK